MSIDGHTPLPAKSVSFEIFPDRIGHWCARRLDGKVCGTFRERERCGSRAECRDGSRLVLITLPYQNLPAAA